MKKKILAAVLMTALLIGGCGKGESADGGKVENKSMTVKVDDVKVTLAEYVGIEAHAEKAEITDSDVDNWIDMYLYYFNQTAESDKQVIEDGDSVQVTMDILDENGDIIDDGTDNDGFVHVGSGTTYEEVEQGIIGAHIGDELEIPITFSDPYPYNEELSGKTATCKITLNFIKSAKEITPENIDDDEADEVLRMHGMGLDENYKGVEGLRTFAKEQLEEQADSSVRASVYNEVCEYLVENCTVDGITEQMITDRINDQIEQIQEMCSKYYETDLAGYCEMIGMTEEDYRADLEESMRNTITLEYIFTAIGDREELEFTEEDFEEYLTDVLRTSDYSTKDELFEEYGEDYIRRLFRVEKVADWVITNADVIYTEPEVVETIDGIADPAAVEEALSYNAETVIDDVEPAEE